MAEEKKMGRGRITIDWEKVEEWAECQCNGVEIAGALGIDKTTLYRRVEEKYGMTFTNWITGKKAKGANLIRKPQFKMMNEGSEKMAIHLGKNYADQTDKSQVDVTSPMEREFLKARKAAQEKTDEELGLE